MLPIQNRLKKKNDFGRVFKKGRSFEESALAIRLAENDLKASRFAFMVSLKVAKKAFLRNKIKRVLRDVIQANLAGTKTGFDVIFFVRRGLAAKPKEEVAEIVARLFKKAKLI